MDSSGLNDHPKIAQLLSDWSRAIQEKDLDALLALVEPDAEFWSNGAPALEGHDAIRATFAAFFDRFDLRQDFELLELIVRQDLAIARGIEHNHLVPSGGGAPTRHLQRAFSIMSRQHDGRWLFSRGITNLPPEPEEGTAGAG